MRFFIQWSALCALIIAKPLFDLFARNTTYFIVNGISTVELLIWVVGLVLIVPLAPSLLLSAISRRNARAAEVVHGILVGLIIGMMAMQICRQAEFSLLLTGLITTTTVLLVAGLFVRLPVVGFGAMLLSPAALIFPVMFLLDPAVVKIVNPGAARQELRPDPNSAAIPDKPPIIFVVMDELPLLDLLDADGNLDKKRFPNFAAFAEGAIWYANTTTVSHETSLAIPAILTGNRPHADSLPTYEDYPHNLFSLLGPHYEMNVIETSTRLNPYAADWQEFKDVKALALGSFFRLVTDCAVAYVHMLSPIEIDHLLPPIHQGWGGFLSRDVSEPGDADITAAQSPLSSAQRKVAVRQRIINHLTRGDRKGLFESFIESISTTSKASFHYLHVLLPHQPQIYLPSGKEYRLSAYMHGLKWQATDQSWSGDQTGMNILHQQHLLQLAFVDRLIGRLIQEVKRLGWYDTSLIVLLSDHGISFRHDTLNRRFEPGNIAELAFVPLLIKPPNHIEAQREQALASTIDILPTLVDMLNIETSWEFDGQSLLDQSIRARDSIDVDMENGTRVRFIADELQRLKNAALRRNIRSFRLNDPRASLFQFQDGLELIGQAAADLAFGKTDCEVDSKSFDRLRSMWPDIEAAPQKINGYLECSQSLSADPLIILTANGYIIGTTRPWRVGGEWVFAYVFPDFESFRGIDTLEIRVVNYPPDS